MTVDFASTGLPVADILDDLTAALETAPSAILEAAPGAGKDDVGTASSSCDQLTGIAKNYYAGTAASCCSCGSAAHG